MNTNIYQTVTERILKQLDEGVLPWRKTWKAGLPKSLSTNKEYRGINILILGMAEFTSRYWLTYRQALRLGGHVRKGEKATAVVYWKWRTPEDLKRLEEKTGKTNLAPCYPFVSAVFNLEQVEGVARPNDDVPQWRTNPLEFAEKAFEVMPDKPAIAHAVIDEPAYNKCLDLITLPHLGQFENAPEYYATLFHELVHSTGHPKRLNRFAQTEGERFERYSFEELVAEFGAAFLCAFAGIQNTKTEALQASYIKGWAKTFQQDHRLIIRAASAAQRATDYIRGKQPVSDGADDSEPDTATAATSDAGLTSELAESLTPTV